MMECWNYTLSRRSTSVTHEAEPRRDFTVTPHVRVWVLWEPLSRLLTIFHLHTIPQNLSLPGILWAESPPRCESTLKRKRRVGPARCLVANWIIGFCRYTTMNFGSLFTFSY